MGVNESRKKVVALKVYTLCGDAGKLAGRPDILNDLVFYEKGDRISDGFRRKIHKAAMGKESGKGVLLLKMMGFSRGGAAA